MLKITTHFLDMQVHCQVIYYSYTHFNNKFDWYFHQELRTPAKAEKELLLSMSCDCAWASYHEERQVYDSQTDDEDWFLAQL